MSEEIKDDEMFTVCLTDEGIDHVINSTGTFVDGRAVNMSMATIFELFGQLWNPKYMTKLIRLNELKTINIRIDETITNITTIRLKKVYNSKNIREFNCKSCCIGLNSDLCKKLMPDCIKSETYYMLID